MSKEYGVGGRGGPDGIDEIHDGKGIRFSKKNKETGETIAVSLKWDQAAVKIANLIDEDNYLNEEEAKEYAMLFIRVKGFKICSIQIKNTLLKNTIRYFKRNCLVALILYIKVSAFLYTLFFTKKDIEVLNNFGYEVLCEKSPGKPNCYCVADRSFDAPELRILMDAVQAASFVTPSKTEVLLDKIADLGGSHRAELLQSNIVRFNTTKSTNENIFYAVIEQILSDIKGRMMEDIVLLETKIANPKKQVFQLQFAVGEFDMVVADNANATCEIYEVKHSKEQAKEQFRHLIDEEKLKNTEFRYGKITKRTVIYRGENATLENGIEYRNVEDYLKSLL